MTEKTEKSRLFTVIEFVSTHIIELNCLEFHGKHILIEEARSQPIRILNFDPWLRNTQNSQNLPLLKKPQKKPSPILLKQNTYNNYSDAFKPRKKENQVFLQ